MTVPKKKHPVPVRGHLCDGLADFQRGVPSFDANGATVGQSAHHVNLVVLLYCPFCGLCLPEPEPA